MAFHSYAPFRPAAPARPCHSTVSFLLIFPWACAMTCTIRHFPGGISDPIRPTAVEAAHPHFLAALALDQSGVPGRFVLPVTGRQA